MISNPKRCYLALTLALGSMGLSAAETAAADKSQLRRELSEAQAQLAELSQRVAELSLEVGGDPARVQMFRYLGNPDRAVIGVILGESDPNGVHVEGVTPGGPAEKAGLRAGDTISAVGGKSITGERPLLALRDALKDLKAGDEVALTYQRDGKSQQAKIAAERQGSFEMFGMPNAHSFVFEMDNGKGVTMPPGIDRNIEAIVERAIGEAEASRVNVTALIGLGGLRLASLNPGLSRYFGVNEGALVLEVDADEYQGLQPGDVILEVDGKAVKDPRDAMHALREQDPAQKVELKLQRDRVPQLVKVTVPEKSRAMPMPPIPPAPPHPAAAPMPPTSPQTSI